jgi:NitT/TauT family transport system substrate-binding protein
MSSERSPQRRFVGWRALLPLLALPFLTTAPACAQPTDRVRVQLNWYNQAQFAGLYVAQRHGFYERERIAIELIEGGPGINPAEVLSAGKADVAVTWLSAAIEARARGHQVINFAQIFRQSGMAIVCRRDAGVHSPQDVTGKVFGVWKIGDELNANDWLKRIGVPAERVTFIEQRPDGLDLIERRAACVTAMMYNEYWSILNGGLSPNDLLTVRLGGVGLGFLEDGLYARSSALQDERQRDILTRFLRATLAGWSYAGDNFEEALAISMASAPRTDAIHQRRMLESVVQLIGDTGRMGLLDLSAYWHSINLVAEYGSASNAVRTAAAHGWTQELWLAAK